MKDKLVFVKTKMAKNTCPECDLYGANEDACDIIGDGNKCNCNTGYCWKLQEEEPQEIQSEYEWKKERFELLNSVVLKITDKRLAERLDLEKWLKENRPTNFVQCDRENTKVGDTVRYAGCDGDYKIDFIINNPLYNEHNCVVNDSCNSFTTELSTYEIDLNKEKE